MATVAANVPLMWPTPFQRFSTMSTVSSWVKLEVPASMLIDLQCACWSISKSTLFVWKRAETPKLMVYHSWIIWISSLLMSFEYNIYKDILNYIKLSFRANLMSKIKHMPSMSHILLEMRDLTGGTVAPVISVFLKARLLNHPIWVCLKIWYIPNYSHLIGIMIINHWV